MIFLLDTNAVSALMKPGSPAWLSSVHSGDRVVTCPIVRGEIIFGIARLPESKRRSDLEQKARQLFAALPCEPIPEQAGDFYASTKLARQRRPLSLLLAPNRP